jgi:hypothetical protein
VSNVRVGIELTGNASSAVSAVSAVTKALGGISGAATAPISAVGNITKALGGLGTAITSPIAAIGKLTSALGTIGLAAQGVEALTGAAKNLAGSLGVGLANELELTRARFMSFTKDAAKTDEILALVRKEADATPFAFNAMASAAASLQVSAKQANEPLLGLLRTSEVLAASNPAEGLQGAAFALKEAVSGDFTSVVERFDIPRTTIARLKAEGLPNLEIVRRAMKEMGLDMDLVSGLAQTTSGRFSTFQDSLDGLRVAAGKPILAALGDALDRLSALVDANRPALTAFAQVIGDVVAKGVSVAVDGFLRLVKAADGLRPAFKLIGDTLTALAHGDMANFAAGLRTLAEQGIAALGAKVRELATGALQFLADKMADFAPTGERFGRLFGTIGDFIANDLLPFLGPAVNAIREMGEKANAGEGPLQAIADKVNDLGQAAEDGLKFVQDHGTAVGLIGSLAAGAVAGITTFRTALALTAAVQGIAAVATGGLTGAVALLYATIRAHPFIAIISVLTLVGTTLAGLYATNEGFRKGVDTAWAAIKVAFTLGAAAAGKALESLGGWLSTAGETVGTLAAAFGRLSADAVAALNGLNAAVSGSLDWLAGQFASAGPRFIALLAGGIRAAAGAAVAAAQETVARIAALLPHSLADEGPLSIPTNWHDPLTGNLAEVGEALRVQFERTFSVIEQVEIDSENKRAKLTRDHQRAQEIEETKYQRRLIDLEEDLAAAKGKARQGVLDRIAQLHEDHGRRVEDQEQAHADRLVEIEFELADDLRDAEERQALQRGAALRELLTDFDALNRQMADKARDIERTMQDGLREATRAAADAARDVWERAQEQIESAIIGLAKSRAIRELRAAFGFGQDQDASGRSERREAEDLQHRRQLDLQQLLDRQAKDDADFARERAEKRTEIEEDQRADGEKLEREYQRDLTKATTDEEKAKVTARIQEKRDELKAKHEEENRARTRREQQEDQERARRRAEEMDERRVREQAENAELARRKQRAAEDSQFRKDQARDLQGFTDDLDDKDLAEKITNIEAERDARIRAIGEALVDKQNQIIRQANAEREVLGDHYAKAVDDLRTKFLQKIGPLMGDELAAVSTLLDLLAGKTAQVAAGIATMTAGAPGGSGGPLSAPLRLGGKSGETAQEVANYYANLGQTPPAAVQAAAIFGNNPPPASVAVIEANPNLSAGGGSGPITVPRFASGGSFLVGGGGPPDSQLVRFMASPNERVTVTTPGQNAGGATYNLILNNPVIYGGNKRQVAEELWRELRAVMQRDAAQNGRIW